MAAIGCSRCGQCGCNCGVLPYTAQVQFAGLMDKVQAEPCPIEFSSCFGEGVQAYVTGPGGCPQLVGPFCAPYCPEPYENAGFSTKNDAGPLQGVHLVSGGKCYAQVGRVSPQGRVFASAEPAGNSGPISVTLRPARWVLRENNAYSTPQRLAEVIVKDDGRGNNVITLSGDGSDYFYVQDGYIWLLPDVAFDYEQEPFYLLTVTVTDDEAVGPQSASATFAVVIADRIDEPNDAKPEPDPLANPELPPPITNLPAEAATFTVVLERQDEELFCPGLPACPPAQDGLKLPYWRVADVSVAGGRGYAGDETLEVRLGEGVIELEPAELRVEAGTSGVPSGVAIVNPGKYYREDRSPGATIVSDVVGTAYCTVRLETIFGPEGEQYTLPIPTAGSTGVCVRGTVDRDPESDTFGQVVDIEIVNAGDKVLGWRHARSCNHLLNGKPITLFGSGDPLVSFELDACYGSGACIVAEPLPERFEPTLRLYGRGTCTNPAAGMNAGLARYGCGGEIIAQSEKKFEDGDPSRPYWTVTSASAGGGTLYTNGSYAEVTLRDPVTQIPDYRCPLVGELPAILLSSTGPAQTLNKATVVSPGKFWLERPYVGEPVPVRKLRIVNAGQGYARYGRVAPTLAATQAETVEGVGVVVTPIVEDAVDECNLRYWYVKAASVSGGTGYSSGDEIEITANEEDTVAEAARLRLRVDAEGVPTEVVVAHGGKYWQDSKSEAPSVASLGVRTVQLAPSKGQGASIAVTIDSDPWSSAFGTVVDAKVVSPGFGYTLLGQLGCSYEAADCDVSLAVASKQSTVVLASGGQEAIFESTQEVGQCDELTLTAQARVGVMPGAVAVAAITDDPALPTCLGPPVCYDRCPDLSLLCIQATVETPFGAKTVTSKDFIWAGAGGRAVGGVANFEVRPPPPDDWQEIFGTVVVQCVDGELRLSVGYTINKENCFCTSVNGCASRRCAPGLWWDGEVAFALAFDCGGVAAGACGAPGSATISISTPGGIAAPC